MKCSVQNGVALAIEGTRLYAKPIHVYIYIYIFGSLSLA